MGDMVTTDMDTTMDSTCNGFDILLFDLVPGRAPTDVCYAESVNGLSTSTMYDCDDDMMMYYNGTQCDGDTWKTDDSSDGTCVDGSDCEYGIAKIYNQTNNVCDSLTYQEVPFMTGCIVANLGGMMVAPNLSCADSSTNGGDVMAKVFFGDECSGFAPYDDELSVVLADLFGLMGGSYNSECVDARCYQAGHDRTTTTEGPTSSPTMKPTFAAGNASMKMSVSLLSAVLVIIGLLK